MVRVLVTGANGYLGRGVVKELIGSGAEVIAADYSITSADPRVETVECDIFNVPDPFIAFREPDVLLHLAWRDGFAHYSANHIIDLPKHYAFISELAKAGVKRIAVMGSMHELGFYEGCVHERTPCIL